MACDAVFERIEPIFCTIKYVICDFAVVYFGVRRTSWIHPSTALHMELDPGCDSNGMLYIAVDSISNEHVCGS